MGILLQRQAQHEQAWILCNFTTSEVTLSCTKQQKYLCCWQM